MPSIADGQPAMMTVDAIAVAIVVVIVIGGVIRRVNSEAHAMVVVMMSMVPVVVTGVDKVATGVPTHVTHGASHMTSHMAAAETLRFRGRTHRQSAKPCR